MVDFSTESRCYPSGAAAIGRAGRSSVDFSTTLPTSGYEEAVVGGGRARFGRLLDQLRPHRVRRGGRGGRGATTGRLLDHRSARVGSRHRLYAALAERAGSQCPTPASSPSSTPAPTRPVPSPGGPLCPEPGPPRLTVDLASCSRARSQRSWPWPWARSSSGSSSSAPTRPMPRRSRVRPRSSARRRHRRLRPWSPASRRRPTRRPAEGRPAPTAVGSSTRLSVTSPTSRARGSASAWARCSTISARPRRSGAPLTSLARST